MQKEELRSERKECRIFAGEVVCGYCIGRGGPLEISVLSIPEGEVPVLKGLGLPGKAETQQGGPLREWIRLEH